MVNKSKAELFLEELFSDKLSDSSKFDQEVKTLMKKHLLDEKKVNAGKDLGTALIQLAETRAKRSLE